VRSGSGGSGGVVAARNVPRRSSTSTAGARGRHQRIHASNPRAEAVRAPRSRQCSDLRPQTSGGWRPRAAARLRLPPVGLDARQEIVVQNLAMMALRMLALALAAGIASAMSTPPDTSLATLPVVYYGANWNRTQENIDVLARFQMVILMQVALASIVASTLSVSLSSLRALD
jgi:hypothetical protein